MNCNEFKSDIPTCLEEADQVLPDDFLDHMNVCETCAHDWTEAVEARDQLTRDAQAIGVPSREMRDRFLANLAEPRAESAPTSAESGLRLHGVLSRYSAVFRVAAGLVLLMVGFALGRVTGTDETQLAGPGAADLRGRLVQAQLQLTAPTARLEAIQETFTMNELDDDVVAALLSAIRNDPNINVRLSAIDALSRFAGDGDIRHGLEDAMPRQQSPLIQTTIREVLN